MAVRISKILQPGLVAMNLVNAKRTNAIHEVVQQLQNHPSMLNFQGFYDEVLARERIESTCLGNEVAFPHARTDHVKDMVIAAGRSVTAEGVWFENCGQKVSLIFVIGTPKKMVTDYLAVVGAMARLLKEPDLRTKLMEAKTGEEFMGHIAAAENSLS
jgi:mannitol/fructose-specific phosphotransferase system IIA component (Ntr-type)